jgi:hypothetical protein
MASQDEVVDKRHGSPEFYKILEEMAELHNRKSHDYASDNNPFGNYIFSGQVGQLFAHSPTDLGFVTRLFEKVYRLANLEGSGRTAKNESIDDTERDLCVIMALWIACRRHERNKVTAAKAVYSDLDD